MTQKSRWYSQTGMAVLMAILLFVVFAVKPTRADTIDPDDPAITPGSSAAVIGTDGGAQTTNVWSYATSTQSTGSISVSFLNNTGSTWTSLEIVANYNTTGHTFTCYPSPSVANLPAGATNPFSVCPSPTVASNSATFAMSGGTGVADGQYFVMTYTNFNTNGNTLLSGFDFTANGGAPTTAPVPEPASMILLGSGIAGVVARKRRKRA